MLHSGSTLNGLRAFVSLALLLPVSAEHSPNTAKVSFTSLFLGPVNPIATIQVSTLLLFISTLFVWVMGLSRFSQCLLFLFTNSFMSLAFESFVPKYLLTILIVSSGFTSPTTTVVILSGEYHRL